MEAAARLDLLMVVVGRRREEGGGYMMEMDFTSEYLKILLSYHVRI